MSSHGGQNNRKTANRMVQLLLALIDGVRLCKELTRELALSWRVYLFFTLS